MEDIETMVNRPKATLGKGFKRNRMAGKTSVGFFLQESFSCDEKSPFLVNLN
jgi:hypothetical protein